MSTVYLNGQFISANDAKISPMDRGFLFGDGIYEVIPCFHAKPVGLSLHLARMKNGLAELKIKYDVDVETWVSIINTLLKSMPGSANAIYIHVSRGADSKRFHAYPNDIAPTVFAYAFPIADEQPLDVSAVKTYKVKTDRDLRWQRCHIKSTSLLGNVMHFQSGQDNGLDEVILYNDKGEITEAAACNVFVVKNGVISTPPLDNHILPGITRKIIIDALSKMRNIKVEERAIDKSELLDADEVWISSSSKEIAPVIEIDGNLVGNGQAGSVWLNAQTAYNEYKFNA